MGWTYHLGISCDGRAPTMGISVISGGIPQLGGMVQLGYHCHHACAICHMLDYISAWGIRGQDVGGSGAWGPLGAVKK